MATFNSAFQLNCWTFNDVFYVAEQTKNQLKKQLIDLDTRKPDVRKLLIDFKVLWLQTYTSLLTAVHTFSDGGRLLAEGLVSLFVILMYFCVGS